MDISVQLTRNELITTDFHCNHSGHDFRYLCYI